MKYKAILEFKASAILGEGPVWDDALGKLYWIDIKKHQVYRYDPVTSKSETWQLDQMVGCVIPASNKSIVCALQDRLIELDTTSGETKYFASIEKDLTENRSNDGKADAAGRLWIGTLNIPGGNGKAALYSIDKNGAVLKQVDKIGMSNGLGWSPDNTKMYLVDTTERHVMQFDFSLPEGSLTNKRIILKFNEADGSPDGMCVDGEGMLWIAFYGAKRVGRYNPTNGQLIGEVEVPAENVTCCTFGGADMDILFITTASEGVKEEGFKAYPDTGSLFSVKTGIKGLKGYKF